MFSLPTPFQLRNKLNQEQSARLQQQKDRLKKNNLEVVAMDQRLGELQERLWKKKAALQQKENLPVSLNNTFITISIYHKEISNKAKKVHYFCCIFAPF